MLISHPPIHRGRHPVVIIEGPDGCGKTTLAHRLERECGLEYARYPGISSSKGSTDTGVVLWWKLQLDKAHENNRVYDRCFYISEQVYQMVMPERMLMLGGEAMIGGIADVWQVNPLIIFCLPPKEVFEKNTFQVGRPQLLGVDERLMRKTYWQYWCMYGLWSNCLYDNVRRHDYTRDEDGSLPVQWVTEYLAYTGRKEPSGTDR
jgi:DNA polymerase III delta prime subunit